MSTRRTTTARARARRSPSHRTTTIAVRIFSLRATSATSAIAVEHGVEPPRSGSPRSAVAPPRRGSRRPPRPAGENPPDRGSQGLRWLDSRAGAESPFAGTQERNPQRWLGGARALGTPARPVATTGRSHTPFACRGIYEDGFFERSSVGLRFR